MKKKLELTLVFMCIFLIALVGCTTEETQIRDFYEEFMQLDLSDPVRAIEEYVYYNDEAIKTIAIDSVEGNYTTHYEILGLEKITDQLWAIELYIETSMDPEGFTAYNFVGEIDGVYKVMRSVNQIPQTLIGDLNLDAYLPTGEYIDPEDVIIDTPIRK